MYASGADPDMGGPGAAPIDQNLGLVAAVRSSLPQTRGEISFKSLTFTSNFQLMKMKMGMKMDKKFSASAPSPGPHQGVPCTPLGGGGAPPPDHCYRLVLCTLAMVPLPNPGSVTDVCICKIATKQTTDI